MPKAYRLRIQNRRRRYQAGSKGRQPFERPSAKPRRAKPEKAVPGPLVKRSRHRPLTPVTRVRFPHGSPIAGVYNAEVPPVPIPNTEVKLSSAEDTWREAAWENRSMPAPKKDTRKRVFFLCPQKPRPPRPSESHLPPGDDLSGASRRLPFARGASRQRRLRGRPPLRHALPKGPGGPSEFHSPNGRVNLVCTPRRLQP